MPHDVFVSYAREDAAAADAVVRTLEERGVTCWIDRAAVAHKAGEEWAEAIVAAIKRCRVMVVVFSRHANASKWVKREVHKAEDAELSIIPFRIEDVAPTGALEMYLATIQWQNAFPNYERHLDTLAARVKDLLPPANEIDEVNDVEVDLTPVTAQGRSNATAGTRSGNRRASGDVGTQARGDQGLTPTDRLAAFQRMYAQAEDLFVHKGPAAVEPYVNKLTALNVDPASVVTFKARVQQAADDRDRLRCAIDSLVPTERWTAIENALRRFVQMHRLATPSILGAAERASQRAEKESRRFDLLAWLTVAGAMVGALMLTACYGFTRWQHGATPSLLAGGTPILGFVGGFVIPSVTIVLATGFMLAVFGVRDQGMYASVAVGLMALAGGAQMVPGAIQGIIQAAGSTSANMPLWLDCLVHWVPRAVLAVSLVMALQFAACKLIGEGFGPPGMTAAVSALLVAFTLLPDRGIGDVPFALLPGVSTVKWAVGWLPVGLLFVALIAASGRLSYEMGWWIVVAFVLIAGFLQSEFTALGGIFILGIGLLVVGGMATLPSTMSDYLALPAFAVASLVIAGMLHWVDRVAPSPYIRLIPLVSLWAIACGSVALRHNASLGPPANILDGIKKEILRRRDVRMELRNRRLTDTAWYKGGRQWHAKRSATTAGRAGARPARG